MNFEPIGDHELSRKLRSMGWTGDYHQVVGFNLFTKGVPNTLGYQVLAVVKYNNQACTMAVYWPSQKLGSTFATEENRHAQESRRC